MHREVTGTADVPRDRRGLHELRFVAGRARRRLEAIERLLPELTGELPEEERERRADAVSRELDALYKMHVMLWVAGRLATGTMAHAPTRFDVWELISGTVRPYTERGGARIELHGPEESAQAWADPAHLGLIVIDLLDNAVRYSLRPVMVTVEVRSGDPISMMIRDHGVGIAPERQREVFEPFNRLRENGDDELDAHAPEAGFGLGLFVCRELAALNGGSLYLEWSAPGHGSRFVLRLPAASVEPTDGG